MNNNLINNILDLYYDENTRMFEEFKDGSDISRLVSFSEFLVKNVRPSYLNIAQDFAILHAGVEHKLNIETLTLSFISQTGEIVIERDIQLTDSQVRDIVLKNKVNQFLTANENTDAIYGISLFEKFEKHPHNNIIVFYKDNNSNNIWNAMLYESYGYFNTNNMKSPMMFQKLMIMLNNIRDEMGQNRVNVLQNPNVKHIDLGWRYTKYIKGYQRILRDSDMDTAFCMFFTMFWWYLCILIRLIKPKYSLISLEEYINQNDNSEKIFITIKTFATRLLQFWSDKTGVDLKSIRFDKTSVGYVFEEYYNTHRKRNIIENDSPCKKHYRCLSGYCHTDGWGQRRCKRKRNINRSCKDSVACLGNRCVNGVCLPCDNDSCKKIGRECVNGECLSILR